MDAEFHYQLSKCIWLANDSDGVRQSVLRDRGYEPHCIEVKSNYSQSHFAHQLQSLCIRKPCTIWVKLLGSNTDQPTKREQKQGDLVRRLAVAQLEARRHVVLEEIGSGNTFEKFSASQALIEFMQREPSRHFWCGMGVNPTRHPRMVHQSTWILTDLPLALSGCACTERMTPELPRLDDVGFESAPRIFRRYALSRVISSLSDELGITTRRPTPAVRWTISRLTEDLGAQPESAINESHLPDLREQSKQQSLVKSAISSGSCLPRVADVAVTAKTVYATEQRFSGPEMGYQDFCPKLMFSTETREHQKANWKATKAEAAAEGRVAVKPRRPRPQPEQHFDDCGEDLSSIRFDSNHCWTDDCVYGVECDTTPPLTMLEEMCIAPSVDPQWMFYGNCVDDHVKVQRSPNAKYYLDFDALLEHWAAPADANVWVDIAELMGGQARTTRVLVRRMLKEGIRAGQNFDLVCGCNLRSKEGVASLWGYIELCRPLIFIMAPVCIGLAGWQSLNRVLHHDTWMRTRRDSVPLGGLCGHVALYQLVHNRDSLWEHPAGTEFNKIDPWPQVLQHPRTVAAVIDQCMTGLRAHKPPYLLMKKASELFASDEICISGLRPLICDGTHEHQAIHGSLSAPSQIWTWKFASLAAARCADLLRARWQQYFPSAGGRY